jgi:hypothetical protein
LPFEATAFFLTGGPNALKINQTSRRLIFLIPFAKENYFCNS